MSLFSSFRQARPEVVMCFALLLAATTILVQKPVNAQTKNAKTHTNSIGMEFVPIPAGSFQMGSPDRDADARDFEKPQHQVTISKLFYVGRFEVTQAQWEQVIGSNPYTRDRSNPYYILPDIAARITRPDHPATVSWNDVQEFITRLNECESFVAMPPRVHVAQR